MDQTTAKRILNELIKREDIKNKNCVDCGNPNPQWASVSFAIFICLQCAGHHRGYGVHISFVRSVSMDTWSEEQIKRMQIGGNGPFKDFMKSYPAAQGGYTEGMEPHGTYHSWAATQYRSKLDADLAGQPWEPSAPPADTEQASGQGLRKSRATGRSATGTPVRSNSGSPASFAQGGPMDQKSQNEAYFAGLGDVNASRPENLPPSQGGKYQGFGSTPSPAPSSSGYSWGISSRAAPSLSDFQENPGAALSKGWSLFSSVVASATRTVNESVIQPGMERVLDPEFQATVKGYASEASKRAAQAGTAANEWGKQSLGVDVAGQVGGVANQLGGSMGWNNQSTAGYGSLSQGPGHDDYSQYHDGEDDEDEFFGTFESSSNGRATSASPAASNTTGTSKKDDDWGEWKDF